MYPGVTVQRVREQANGQGVSRGVVVLENAAEVVQQQEGRTTVSGREKQGRQTLLFGLDGSERVDPERAPFAQAAADVRVGLGIIETRWQADFKAPGLAIFPARCLQVMSRGRQGVGGGVPQVAAAIAIKVHGMLIEGGRHKLGLAHGACPGADQPLRRAVTGLQDLQRRQQLAAPEDLATAIVGQGGEGADHVVAADIAAVIAFHAPDGDQYFMVNGIGAADGF